MDIEQLAGTRLGNYEIESLLGRGGMGVVYKARQISLDRSVALKILPPSLSSDSSFVKRFQREAQAVAKLSHPNILHIYDVGEEKDLSFFSMEYVEGKTLDEVLKEKGSLDADEAVRIITQAAEGIEHTHENNILHRDIKPSNIILDKRGNVKVMDFGLARMTEDRSKLTQSGTLMGTLDYMSPEQCRGEELDERTDIYSLGVVLYEILTGKVPFEAPNEAALIHKIINEEPKLISILQSDIPSAVEDVIQKTLRKNPDERYQDMQSLISDLKSARTRMVAVETKKSPSIAVLPFVDMSPAKDQEYFCDGLAEELINALTQIKDLRVVARTSAFSFKGKDARIHDIGKELHVETVLEGSVRKAGNRIRITAQLVNVNDGYHLWSEKFDRDMEDVFAIQDEISEAIVGKLKPRLLREEKAKLAKRQTVNMEAYSLYLRGRYFWNKMNEESLRKAVIFFQCAIEIDPAYAAAYAGLAHAYMDIPWYSLTRPSEFYPKAKEAAFKALELDAGLSEAVAAVGHIKTIYDWDWEGAESKLTEAIDLNPGNATAHLWYGYYLTLVTRFDEAIREMEIALELDPLSLFINIWAGTTLFYAGEYDRAIAALQRTIEMEPNYIFAHSLLGFAYLRKSMIDKALNELEIERAISGGHIPAADAVIISMYVWMGKTEEARNILDRLLALAEKEYVSPVMIALGHFSLGDNDQGFEWLEKAYEDCDGWLAFIKVLPYGDPALDPICSDPRYLTLLKKMNLNK